MKRFLCLLVVFLTGCGGSVAIDPRTFDLGLDPPSTQFPPVRLGLVRAVAPFDSTDMHYRLAWRNTAEIGAFANSRWAASPPEMLRKQMLRGGGEKAGRCILDVEVQEFTQVFTAKEASEVRIELRAWLAGASERLAQRGWSVVEPNAGADAPAAVGAFAKAADRALAELGTWISSQPECR